jgi:hypothetical protein
MPDHAGRPVSLDALCGSWWRCAQESRFELLAMDAVIDPFARSGDSFAGRNDGRMAHS